MANSADSAASARLSYADLARKAWERRKQQLATSRPSLISLSHGPQTVAHGCDETLIENDAFKLEGRLLGVAESYHGDRKLQETLASLEGEGPNSDRDNESEARFDGLDKRKKARLRLSLQKKIKTGVDTTIASASKGSRLCSEVVSPRNSECDGANVPSENSNIGEAQEIGNSEYRKMAKKIARERLQRQKELQEKWRGIDERQVESQKAKRGKNFMHEHEMPTSVGGLVAQQQLRRATGDDEDEGEHPLTTPEEGKNSFRVSFGVSTVVQRQERVAPASYEQLAAEVVRRRRKSRSQNSQHECVLIEKGSQYNERHESVHSSYPKRRKMFDTEDDSDLLFRYFHPVLTEYVPNAVAVEDVWPLLRFWKKNGDSRSPPELLEQHIDRRKSDTRREYLCQFPLITQPNIEDNFADDFEPFHRRQRNAERDEEETLFFASPPDLPLLS